MRTEELFQTQSGFGSEATTGACTACRIAVARRSAIVSHVERFTAPAMFVILSSCVVSCRNSRSTVFGGLSVAHQRPSMPRAGLQAWRPCHLSGERGDVCVLAELTGLAGWTMHLVWQMPDPGSHSSAPSGRQEHAGCPRHRPHGKQLAIVHGSNESPLHPCR